MGTLSSSSTSILRHIFRPPPPPSSFSFFKHRLSIPLQTTPLRTFFSSPPLLFPHSLSSLNSQSQTPFEEKTELESGNGDFEPEKETVSGNGSERVLNSSKLPSLSVKEKKELASYAHSLGKKLKSQQVGKSGVTDSVAMALIETLEANELLKLKIHGSCPGELDDVVKQLEEATGSVVVGRIGRTVIIYRPSLTKLKAEEKRNQARRIFVRKRPGFKPSLQNEGPALRLSGRGRHRTSRF